MFSIKSIHHSVPVDCQFCAQSRYGIDAVIVSATLPRSERTIKCCFDCTEACWAIANFASFMNGQAIMPWKREPIA